MEERDTHYALVLGKRKRAVSGIDPTVLSTGTNARSKAAHDAVEKLVKAPIFDDMVDSLLDAIVKGSAVIRPIWRFGELWTPYRYKREDQRKFLFARGDEELRIREEGNPDSRLIPLCALIVHRPHLKSGLTVSADLARLLAWTFMLKTYTLQDWAAFLETFGMPLRVGKYDKNASAEEKRVPLPVCDRSGAGDRPGCARP